MAWYDEFFDGNYIKTYGQLDWERTSREVDFMEKALELSPQNLILDIPCGFGRHSIELTKRGYRVVGMEYSLPQIEFARRLMIERGAPFEIVRADMRQIPHERRYDRLINYYTSFGYFDDEENEKTMGNFYKALKPGGMMMLEMANRDGVLKFYQPTNITRLPEGELLLEERNYNVITGRMCAIHTYIDKEGKSVERKLDYRMYTPYELIAMFKRHGFEIVRIYGDGEEELKIFSRRICIIAKRPLRT